jgi:hypothetical protein
VIAVLKAFRYLSESSCRRLAGVEGRFRPQVQLSNDLTPVIENGR